MGEASGDRVPSSAQRPATKTRRSRKSATSMAHSNAAMRDNSGEAAPRPSPIHARGSAKRPAASRDNRACHGRPSCIQCAQLTPPAVQFARPSCCSTRTIPRGGWAAAGGGGRRLRFQNFVFNSEKSRSCLDCSRRKDIQARTVKGRLSWTGRRYQAGTIRGRPNWFGSLLPEVQGTSSWFISWMLKQHEDQAQSVKSSSSAESRAELNCRVQAQNAQMQNISSADQVRCTRAVIECEAVYKSSDQVHA
ncbi:hypothetical protein F511_22503 [Dorcoceras hygrometricum]|uniref:Uncharacterized protein n=1 Tax=Dorcoceras hygrometricum TaxID=472368 RepID=A0A2Z7A7N1_9LAMI|nr:hypothetical protein F511_22503 [Dorcoceras hygrometricum]